MEFNAMKRIVLAVALLLLPSIAFAQCNGVFPSATVCGNPVGAPNIPGPLPLSSFALAPGGVSGNVQTNNGAGGLAGITNTQLTALINPFSSILNGLVPASGGSSTTVFLNQAGSWTAAPTPTGSTGPGTGVRQAILSSAVNTSGEPVFATVGSGLNVNLVATATPLILTYPFGFNSFGATDFVASEVADVTSFWASLPANQYSFLAIDRNTSTGVLTASQTLVRPQRGPSFYAPRQALLHLENNATDDWGNAWTAVGAGVSYTAGCAKFGSFGANITGGTSYIQTVSIFNPGVGNWFESIWFKLTAAASQSIMSVGNSYGAYVATSASSKLTLFLSSNGVAWDISNGTTGTTTITTGSFHNIELDFNGAGYVLYLDGVAEISVSSSAIVWPDGVAMGIGTQVGTGTGATSNSCFDEFEFGTYARHVANFTPAVAASAVAGDWFDTNQMIMKTAASAGPTWTNIQRIYVAEAITGAGTVTSVTDYSATKQYRGADFSLDSIGRLHVGNHVIYAQGTPQFITGSTPGTPCTTVKACLIGSPATWTLNGPTSVITNPAQQVPPDAKWFDIQINVFHAAIATNNQDCTLQTRLPIGTIQGFVALGYAYSNLTGLGSATDTTAFTEVASTIARFPVINGVAAFQTSIGGPTCATGGTNNQARIVTGILVGYDMP
jgi:hypothetical protein